MQVLTFHDQGLSVTTPKGRQVVKPLAGEPQIPGELKLKVLSSGPLPPNPGEIVGSRQLAAILRQARKDKGMVQMKLAGRIGTTKSVISRLENHAGDIRLSTLRKLAAALGLRLEIKLT